MYFPICVVGREVARHMTHGIQERFLAAIDMNAPVVSCSHNGRLWGRELHAGPPLEQSMERSHPRPPRGCIVWSQFNRQYLEPEPSA